jgi:hypothetical protein
MKMKEKFRNTFFLHFEWLALTGLLVAAAAINPYSPGASFCLFDAAGIEYCPGEGLGRSIAHLFRGNFYESVQAHPVGFAAVLIIMIRVGSILHRNRQYQSNGG